MSKPVILSCFAQHPDQRELKFLEDEFSAMRDAWRQDKENHKKSYYDVDYLDYPATKIQDIPKYISKFQDSIVLFHYGGHAGSQKLFLKDGIGHGVGLAVLLGGIETLQLVFLNGCATHDQVAMLFDKGVKAVLATKYAIGDKKAHTFATTFYNELAKNGVTIQKAYNHAVGALGLEDGVARNAHTLWNRGVHFEKEEGLNVWELFVKPGDESILNDPTWWRIGDLPSSFSTLAILLSPKGVDNPNVFIGREQELKTIRGRLVKGGKLMLINAEGGIGKTTLAARYWNESLYEYQHNAWLFCKNGIVNALKELAPKLNVDLVSMDEAQQLVALRHALSQVHDDFLLVLDNANDADDIEHFQQQFAGFHWHVLITSRCQGVLEKEQELSITHLPPPLAKELFERYYKENSPDFDALLDRLLKAIGYHTLLVEVFAKNLREASELGTMLADFLQKLETGGLYLGEGSFSIQTPYPGYVQKVAATTDKILDILYDFSKLSEDQRYLLVNLALLPAENYKMLFLIEVMAPVDRKVYHTTLKSLYMKGWIGGMDRTYRLSPVVQKIVLEKNKMTLSTDAETLLQNLAERMANKGRNYISLSLSEAAPLARLASTISQHLIHNPIYELASLNFNAGIYFENTGNLVQARQAYERYGKISADIGRIRNVAVSYVKLGSIYQATGDWKNALEKYQDSFKINKKTYQSNPKNLAYKHDLAVSYEKLGGIYMAKGEWEIALQNYQEYNRLGLEIYQSNPENLRYKQGLGISYERLGGIYQAKGDLKNALKTYNEHFRIVEEIYLNSPENLAYKHGLAISHAKLGEIFEEMGDWKNGLEYFKERNRISQEIYLSSPENLRYQNNLAISYGMLGGMYEKMGDIENALEKYRESYTIVKEIHQSSPQSLPYKNVLAVSYYKLGKLYKRQKELSLSLEYSLNGYNLFRELWESTEGQNVKYTSNFAESTINITQIYKELIQENKYEKLSINKSTEEIKAMRRETYTAFLPFAEDGILNREQQEFFNELAEESWYEF